MWGSETPITGLTCKFAGGDGTPRTPPEEPEPASQPRLETLAESEFAGPRIQLFLQELSSSDSRSRRARLPRGGWNDSQPWFDRV